MASSFRKDSPRSWAVAASCFCVLFFIFGLTESAGLLFVATVHRYSTTRERASLPFALVYCLRSAVGPVVSYFGQKFGIRRVTLVGCLFSSASVALCFFATGITELILLWGIIFGISFGFGTCLIGVILTEHFDKQLVKANALSISGTSLGALALSLIIAHSVETYGLSGTFLIMAGLVLNCVPAVLVMILNKPPPEKHKTYNDLRIALSIVGKECSVCKMSDRVEESVHAKSRCEQTCKEAQNHIQTPTLEINPKSVKNKTMNRLNETPILESKLKLNFSAFRPNNLYGSLEKREDRQVIFNDCLNWANVLNANSCSAQYSERKTSETNKINNNKTKWQLHQLLTDPIYIIIITGTGAYYFIITTFLTIIVDFAIDLGVSSTSSTYIITWIALWDLIGYALQSWIIGLGRLSQSQFVSLNFFFLCVVSAAMTRCSTFALLLLLVSFFEISQGGIIVLASPLVAECVEVDLHATGIASLTILSFPMNLAISPLIGYFRDGGGSYVGVFYVISACSFMCGALFLCIPKLQERRQHELVKNS